MPESYELIDDSRLDVRVIPHSIRRGLLTAEEVQAELDKVPDEAEFAVESTARYTASVADRGTRRR